MLIIGGITKVSPNETGGATVDIDDVGMDLYVPAEVVDRFGKLLVVGVQVAITVHKFGIVDWVDAAPWLDW